jgi:hypothetical protein
LQIEGLIEFPRIPENIPPLPETVSTHTRKISAYADDANMLIALEYETLHRIKVILEQFGAISGLRCNVEKTNLLPLGENINFDVRIHELGFNIVDKLTVLGLEIDRNGATENNFSRVAYKIKALIANWKPYNLSLPGRINIAKSLLYSQINYLGCFQSFPNRHRNHRHCNHGFC